MRTVPRSLGLLVVLALVAAACSGDGDAATSSSTTSSSTTTSSTTVPSDPCSDLDAGLTVDLDGAEPAERVILVADGGGSSIFVCEGATTLARTTFGDASATVMGAVDLDDTLPLEILLATETDTGPAVRVARTTLRGLEVTDVLASRSIDPPYDGETLFEATGFECADIDDDGVRELLVTAYRPADTPGFEGGEGQINVRISVVVADGATITTGGIDQFETDLASAHARLVDDPRCAAGSAGRIDIRFSESGWGPLDSADAFAGRGDSIMTAIAVDGSGMHVAVGAESPNMLLGDFFDPRPAIWWSVDRITWARVDLGDARGELRDVAALDGGGFVAVGRDPDGAVAWVSLDGKEWEPVAVPAGSDGSPGISGHVLSAVVVTPFGIVAAGTENYEPDATAPGEDLDPAVWVSEDGIEWRRVDHPAFGSPGFQMNDGAEFNGEILDVTFAPGIGIVAAGSASDPDPTIDYPTQYPTAWVSPDGATWQRVRIDLDGRLRGVVATDEQVAVLGTTDLHGSPTSDAAIMVSSDGLDWVPANGAFAGLTEPDGIQAVNDGLLVPTHGVFVFGSDEAESEIRSAAAVWRSAGDLALWERVAHDRSVFGAVDESPAFTMTGGAWDGTVLTVVGFTGRTIELPGGGTACCVYEPAIWLWDPDRAGGQ